ncbi:Uncharacterised protein [BD1-7 clade bacterium]|uniref:Uncharacterized protein n=1 Tax=BD1-7 clade bacterium TaxID=2029982 RepID=A0A5S9PV33_9GAMM|nr:Uncharacterised protein [BD1-7 clade bacterium]CAA0108201.1 Uncharacterised protein [BD1-7 clade bacterium]
MAIELDYLVGSHADVRIQYFDVDRVTLMHENAHSGIVHHVDLKQGITLAIDGNSVKLFKVPPLPEAWRMQPDGSYQVRWAVYRMQEKRQDGQHEWWEWLPQ